MLILRDDEIQFLGYVFPTASKPVQLLIKTRSSHQHADHHRLHPPLASSLHIRDEDQRWKVPSQAGVLSKSVLVPHLGNPFHPVLDFEINYLRPSHRDEALISSSLIVLSALCCILPFYTVLHVAMER